MGSYRSAPALARYCAHCSTGIERHDAFHECTYCHLAFCLRCSTAHQPTHGQALVTVYIDSRIPEPDVQTEQCAACKKRAYFRFSCLDCEHALCRTCWYDKGINMHRHKTYTAFESPHDLCRRQGVNLGCCGTASVNHCGSCAMPLLLGQDVFFCKLCYSLTGDALYLCSACYNTKDRHPEHHAFNKWTFDTALRSRKPAGIHCKDCGKAITSVLELQMHPHTSYLDVYTEKHLNEAVARAYRQCQQKVARRCVLGSHSGSQCTMCFQKTNSSSHLNCRQCNETLVFCLHCAQYASKLHLHTHRHAAFSANIPNSPTESISASAVPASPSPSASQSPPPRYTTINTSPSPDNSQFPRQSSPSLQLPPKSSSEPNITLESNAYTNNSSSLSGFQSHGGLLENISLQASHGSTQSQAGKFQGPTFQQQQATFQQPSSFPPPPSMSTPDLPPRQHFNSAPAAIPPMTQHQHLAPPTSHTATESKRKKVTTGLKKAYAFSQKNAFTKAATRVGIGVISSAIIGQDMSGICDWDFSNGGGDVGTDTDVSSVMGSDSGNLGANTPIAGSSSNVTEWMQQQTWQNVTLPQTGWPSSPASLPIGGT